MSTIDYAIIAFYFVFTLGVGLILLWRALRDLEFHVFMRQPLT